MIRHQTRQCAEGGLLCCMFLLWLISVDEIQGQYRYQGAERVVVRTLI